jgi:hypothetical protein
MAVRTSFAIFAAAVIAIGASGTAHALASSDTGQPIAIDLSAQSNQDQNQKKNKKGSGQKPAHQNVQRKTNVQQNTVHKNRPSTVTRKSTVKKTTTTKTTTPTAKSSGAPKALRVITTPGPRTVTAARIRGVSASGAGSASIRGRNYSTWRGGGYRVRRGNSWVTFVPLAVLAGIVIAGNNYYPYAYISAPRDYCDGLTEDGCQLMWDDVQTVEGDVVSQCVAYCPWQD